MGVSVIFFLIYIWNVIMLPLICNNFTLDRCVYVNFMLAKGLQNNTNQQHKFLYKGSTPQPSPLTPLYRVIFFTGTTYKSSK